jgi:hypothetical protein
MECGRDATNTDYWMQQYYKLVTSVPNTIRDNRYMMDDVLVQLVHACDGDMYTPMLAQHQVLSVRALAALDDAQLRRMGVDDDNVRTNLLTKAQGLLGDGKQQVDDKTSSATAILSDEHVDDTPASTLISARYEMECIVCMNAPVACVFAPCGHVCCCAVCAGHRSMVACPLCRARIDNKINVQP